MELKGSTLLKHALKHGYECAEHYLQDARNFLDSKVSGTIESFTSNEGYYFKYDKVTNEFGIINKFGEISTYFRPDEGIEYWLEQVEKYAPK